MITGAHFLLYSTDADADRAFFKDVLGWPSVDAGHGWLIFRIPPAEAAVHPAEDTTSLQAGHGFAGLVLYLMCPDLEPVMESMRARGVPCGSIAQAPWGRHTTLTLPSGVKIGLYQPSHPTAIQTGAQG